LPNGRLLREFKYNSPSIMYAEPLILEADVRIPLPVDECLKEALGKSGVESLPVIDLDEPK